MTRARRIAVIGIDGSGKSTLMRMLATGDDLAVIHCPQYHTHPDAALGSLSRALDAYSLAADALGSFELKAAALYLQMTLFGPVEKAMEDAFAPRFLLCERHPIVDTLAYGPFYRRMVTKAADAALEPRLEAEMERRHAGSYAALHAWHRAENRRLGKTTSFWELANEVAAAIGAAPAKLFEDFGTRYRTTLPDVAIFLDVEAPEARARIAARGGGGELHETVEYLGALRQSYQAALQAAAAAGVRVHTIPTGGREIDACYQDLVRAAEVPR